MTIRRTPAAAQDSAPPSPKSCPTSPGILGSAPERSPHVGGPPALGGVVHGSRHRRARLVGATTPQKRAWTGADVP